MADIKIGWIVADRDEYVPVRALSEKLGGERRDIHGLEGHCFSIKTTSGTATVQALLCGIGKVNAAAAAAFLVADGAAALLGFGLSGGMSGVARGDIVAATTLCEHDFDLTCCGYSIGEKPNQEYIYSADSTWCELFKKACPRLKTGAVVSGDSFVSDDGVRKMLVEKFGAVACDMESAAEAYVALRCGVPYAALRLISDDAGDDAVSSYRELNSTSPDTLVEIVYNATAML